MRFMIQGDEFHEPVLRSTYVPGLTYTVRPQDTILAEFVKKWIAEGRAVVLDPETTPGMSEVSAVGTVT